MASRNNQNRNRRKGPKRPELWKVVPEPPEPDDIVPAPDPTSLLRSLGDPPLHHQRVSGGHHIAAVVERAAGLAVALAAAADLLPPAGDGRRDG